MWISRGAADNLRSQGAWQTLRTFIEASSRVEAARLAGQVPGVIVDEGLGVLVDVVLRENRVPRWLCPKCGAGYLKVLLTCRRRVGGVDRYRCGGTPEEFRLVSLAALTALEAERGKT